MHAYDDPEDPDVAYFDFPQLENHQVYHTPRPISFKAPLDTEHLMLMI